MPARPLAGALAALGATLAASLVFALVIVSFHVLQGKEAHLAWAWSIALPACALWAALATGAVRLAMWLEPGRLGWSRCLAAHALLGVFAASLYVGARMGVDCFVPSIARTPLEFLPLVRLYVPQSGPPSVLFYWLVVAATLATRARPNASPAHGPPPVLRSTPSELSLAATELAVSEPVSPAPGLTVIELAPSVSACPLPELVPLAFEIRERGAVFKVPASAVSWFESAANYVQLHVGDQAHLVRETLKELELRLDPERFVRVHRSAIVNLAFVRCTRTTAQGPRCVLRDGREVKVSRHARSRIDDALARLAPAEGGG